MATKALCLPGCGEATVTIQRDDELEEWARLWVREVGAAEPWAMAALTREDARLIAHWLRTELEAQDVD